MLSGTDVFVSSQNTSHPAAGQVCLQQEGREAGCQGFWSTDLYFKASSKMSPELSVPIIQRRKWRQDVDAVLGDSPLKGVLGTSSFDTGGPRILLLQPLPPTCLVLQTYPWLGSG